MHEACIEACSTAASLFGPLGELAIFLVAGALVIWSRFQVRRSRSAEAMAKTEAQALHTAIVSLRPDAAQTIEALRAPRTPVELVDSSAASTDEPERETQP